jgi:hypothetical protein
MRLLLLVVVEVSEEPLFPYPFFYHFFNFEFNFFMTYYLSLIQFLICEMVLREREGLRTDDEEGFLYGTENINNKFL